MKNDELIIAATEGNLRQVELLLDKGANVNLADALGNTALIWAAHNGHQAIVQQLIAAKADVNHANQRGVTALILATANGRADIVRELIAAGADVNLANQVGNTALMWAAEHGCEDIVQQLIAAGADVNLANQVGNTALILAAANGRADIVRELIAAGADLNLANQDGSTALMRAAQYKYWDIAQQLMAAGADVNLADRFGGTAFMWAASIIGGEAIVRELIAARADVNHADRFGRTAFMWAAQYKHWDIAQQLMAAGADVNLAKPVNRTALMWAAENGHKGVIRAILGDGLFNLSSTDEELQRSLDRINQITSSLEGDEFKKDRKIIREYFSQFLKESIEQMVLAEHGQQVLKNLILLRDNLDIIQQNEEEKKSGKQKTAMKALLVIIDSVEHKISFDQEKDSKELTAAVDTILSSKNLNDQAIDNAINTLLNTEMLPNGNAKKELLNYLKTLEPTDFKSLKTKLKCIALATGGVGVRQKVQGKLAAIFSEKNSSYDQNPYLFILRTGQSKFEQKDTTSFDALKDEFKPSKPGFFNRGFTPDSGTSGNKKEPLPGLKNTRGDEDL